MMIVNRFVELAQQFGDHEIPFDRVFRGADVSESDSIVEAMYVIADRRAKSGKPVAISEITSGIPELVENKSVLDAAIDICLDGLISQGFSHDEAYDALLQSTASVLKKVDIEESANISTFIEHSTAKGLHPVRRLPAEFGKKDSNGRGRYELRRLLGSGSQGTMYEAVDRVFAEEGHPSLVAVKIAHDGMDGERSKLEGARARRVRHKNVARVHDCGIACTGESYVTYELVDGLPLDAWVKNRQQLSPDEACEIVAKLAEGMQCAHNAGVIHRDLKPSNILMNREGEPIIIDFGIAHTSTNDPRLCSFYGTRGSLAFMAPEQYHGGKDGVMPSVDTYALGGLLYWLLTGKFPNGETVSDALIRLDIRNEGGAGRVVYDRRIDQRLVRIADRALAVDLSDRYNSAATLALDLESYLKNRPIPWLDQSWMIQTNLFAKRNPLAVVLYVVFAGLIGLTVAIWMNAQAQIRLEQLQSVATVEQVKLNGQIELEQDRVRQLRERNLMGKDILDAWISTANNHQDEALATANMLFLYTMSTSGFLDDDPELAEKMLLRRIETAEGFLATLTSENSSPIQRAQWHEMLGAWYIEQGDPKGDKHLTEAMALVSEFASEDTIWQNRLLDLGSN